MSGFTTLLKACGRLPGAVVALHSTPAMWRPAKMGQGMETVLDVTKRRTKVLDCVRPAFHWDGLDQALEETRLTLCPWVPPGKLKATVHNVLLYEEGDFFKVHRDAPKTDTHLFTMSVDASPHEDVNRGTPNSDNEETTNENVRPDVDYETATKKRARDSSEQPVNHDSLNVQSPSIVLDPKGRASESWTSTGNGSWIAFHSSTFHEVSPVKNTRYTVTLNVSVDPAVLSIPFTLVYADAGLRERYQYLVRVCRVLKQISEGEWRTALTKEFSTVRITEPTQPISLEGTHYQLNFQPGITLQISQMLIEMFEDYTTNIKPCAYVTSHQYTWDKVTDGGEKNDEVLPLWKLRMEDRFLYEALQEAVAGDVETHVIQFQQLHFTFENGERICSMRYPPPMDEWLFRDHYKPYHEESYCGGSRHSYRVTALVLTPAYKKIK